MHQDSIGNRQLKAEEDVALGPRKTAARKGVRYVNKTSLCRKTTERASQTETANTSLVDY